MTAEAELLRLVAVFEDVFNRHATEDVLAMFTDDAVLEIEGVTRLEGKAELRKMFGYDAGVKTHLQLVNRSAAGDTVTCQVVETNDRVTAAGLDVLMYTLCELTFEKGLIRMWRTVPEQGSTQAFSQFWTAVTAWVVARHPADCAKLYTRDGQFVRSRENGVRIVELAKQYRSERGSQSR
jgi:limonene-1,2-epoxide hydrolase